MTLTEPQRTLNYQNHHFCRLPVIFVCIYIYSALPSEPTKIMVMVVNGKKTAHFKRWLKRALSARGQAQCLRVALRHTDGDAHVVLGGRQGKLQ